ncbi:MAG: hypothetical protein H7301_08835 [Cryobacterium sp.]|nr:hypothetical protein [Oligoflexia bacterium]
MKKHNDENFSTAIDSDLEETFENKTEARFVEESNSGQTQNPANHMPLSSKVSEFVGGFQTSAARAAEERIEKSREKLDEVNPKHKITTDKFAADPGKNLPPRS